MPALGFAVNHLFIGKHRPEFRTPPHGLLRNARQTAFKKLKKNPLRPAVKFRIGGIHFARPIDAQADALHLLFKSIDVVLRIDGRMNAGRNRILFRRQPERIPSHRMQNIEPAGFFIPTDNVGCRVALDMPDVQPRRRRVRKHVQNPVFRLRNILRCPKRLMFLPIRLPTGFDGFKIVIRVPRMHAFMLKNGTCDARFIWSTAGME